MGVAGFEPRFARLEPKWLRKIIVPPGHPDGSEVVPHPALQPGAEVVDPSKVKLRLPRARRAGIRPSGAGF